MIGRGPHPCCRIRECRCAMCPRCWKWELPYDSGNGRSSLWRVAGMNRQFSAIMAAQGTLLAWENFYIIVGSSAGALTGLQFVVMALVSDSQARTDSHTIDTFGTPTVVHFCAVLLVSALLSAPWPALSQAATAIGITGAVGVVYSLIVVRRVRGGMGYKPEMEDWIFHCVLPLIGYATLLASGATLTLSHVPALFGVAVFTLILLFVGIHNAWDTVTYVTIALPQMKAGAGQESAQSDTATQAKAD